MTKGRARYLREKLVRLQCKIEETRAELAALGGRNRIGRANVPVFSPEDRFFPSLGSAARAYGVYPSTIKNWIADTENGWREATSAEIEAREIADASGHDVRDSVSVKSIRLSRSAAMGRG